MEKMHWKNLLSWFLQERRPFPWREDPTPYSVWVSEMMLQQTRAEVVVPYFLCWMQKFPTPAALARASELEVMKAWEGLGYYARARALHAGAKALVKRGYSDLTEELLEDLPGIGPYTRGAILSFAFHQRSAAVDGNVLRVISRLFCLQQDIAKSSTQRQIRQLVQELLPESEPWVAMEALIELGAVVCRREPKCPLCPLSGSCKAHKKDLAESLPKSSKKSPTIALHRNVLVIVSEGAYLLKKGRADAVMGGLYEFPYFEKMPSNDYLEDFLGERPQFLATLEQEKHTFTKYRVTLSPTLLKLSKKKRIETYEWICHHTMQHLPFSSGHRKILKQLENYADLTHRKL